MGQRLIKVILPATERGPVWELLAEREALFTWPERSEEDRFVLNILLDSGLTENVMDTLEKRFAHLAEFRVVLLPVEASLPREKPSEPPPETAAATEEPPPPTVGTRVSREELYSDIVDGTRLTRVFLVMVALSTVVAAIGLLRGNVAVIIGAMVIAPLLGPSVALALATNLADRELGRDAARTLLAGFALALVLSAGMGALLKVDPQTPEIALRTHVGLSDILLALGSGAAGVLGFTTGAPSTVIGVMVAVALIPPLTVCGLLLGSGHLSEALHALILFVTNVIAINLAGLVTFYLQGISPRTWWAADRAARAMRRAGALWLVLLLALAGLILFPE